MLKKLLPVVFLLVGLGAGGAAGLFLRPGAPMDGTAAQSAPADAGHGAAADAHAAPKPDAHATPAKTADAHAAPSAGHAPAAPSGGHGGGETADGHDFVKLNNQFIIPVLEHGKVTSLVILSLSLEVAQGGRDKVFALEPKLRDALLRVLFDHANAGGFDGNFTSGNNMVVLRDALKEAAVKTLGPILIDVLIIDMVRQDA